MKLLLDQNLSYRLLGSLSKAFPGSAQVGQLMMGDADDRAIWEYAKRENYTIVTQDADFHEYSILHGGPPLVIWLKCGNQSNKVILSKLLDNQILIEESQGDSTIWCVEIY